MANTTKAHTGVGGTAPANLESMTPGQKTITILGRTFEISTRESSRGIQYILTGKRGATYGTMRNVNDPTLMFLISGSAKSTRCSLGTVWLTDKNGHLELVKVL